MNTATAEMPTDELTPPTPETATVGAHAERRSSRDMVLEAIMELNDSEMSSKTPDLVRVTGLSHTVVHDSIKVLKQRGQIYSDNGAFFVCSEHQPAQPVYHTAMPDGIIKLEKGDQILTLNPREARAVARTMGGLVEQAASNSVVHRITELTATDKGTQCLFQLVADLVGDGVRGDDEREGMEEAMASHSQIIQIDQISHGVKNKGKLDDQKNVINFRFQGKDKLSYWLANRADQLAFLTMSGISYAFENNGALRIDSVFPGLTFAADVTAPSAKRSLMWDGTSLAMSNTGSITTGYVPKYNMIVDAIAVEGDFTAEGKPHLLRLKAAVGFAVTREEADE